MLWQILPAVCRSNEGPSGSMLRRYPIRSSATSETCWTGSRGYYLSAPHRVRNASESNRLSFAFFFDPNFNAEVKPIPIGAANR
jgi:hypothetical protein